MASPLVPRLRRARSSTCWVDVIRSLRFTCHSPRAPNQFPLPRGLWERVASLSEPGEGLPQPPDLRVWIAQDVRAGGAGGPEAPPLGRILDHPAQRGAQRGRVPRGDEEA